MNIDRTINNENPRATASSLSVLGWWWTIKLFKKGYNKILGIEDLYAPLAGDKSNVLGDRLEEKWKEAVLDAKKFNYRPSLAKTIFITFLPEYIILGCLQLFNELILGLGIPLLLGALLKYFKPESTTTYGSALIYAAGISIATFVSCVTRNQSIFRSTYTGGRVRIALSSLVYRKALRLSKAALGETPSAKVVSLLANDVNRSEFSQYFLQYVWSSPLTTLFTAFLLYRQAGWAGMVGLVPIVVFSIFQAYAGKIASKFRLKASMKTDERVRLMNEIISGVQVIKFYAWEKPFCALVGLARRLELREVKKSCYMRGLYMSLFLFISRGSLYSTSVAMLLAGENLSADKIFAFYSFLQMASINLFGLFTVAVTESAEGLIAIERLQNFLLFDEFQSGDIKINYLSIKPELSNPGDEHHLEKFKNSSDNLDSSWAIKLENVTARWSLDSLKPILNDVSVQVEKGKLYVVIGTVGSGKSSLFSTILGEMTEIQGKLQINGEISYSSQEAWVFGSSIRQNILFGLDYDKQRYWNVVQACALEKDFEQFSLGDQTIVGERGSSLSGGQKARINLARSIYRKADVYLLDDPLSAVDAHVGKHIFEECIQNYLANKTRILATHQIQYLRAADSIIVLDKGHVEQYNNYQDFLNAHPEYSTLTIENKPEETSKIDSFSSAKNKMSDFNQNKLDEEKEEKNLNNLAGFIEGDSRKVVPGNIAFKYFSLGSGTFALIIFIFVCLLTQLIVSLTDFFISILVDAEEYRSSHSLRDFNFNATTNISFSGEPFEKKNILPQSQYIIIYSSLVVLTLVFGLTRSLTFYNICISCSQRLHDLAFEGLIHASMRFFGTNPSGRILNRFSKDLSAIDELLPKAVIDSFQIILRFASSVAITCIVNPFFFIPVSIMTVIFHWMKKIYLKTSKNLKRIEGMVRSPVFTHLNVTLDGISTIRACKAQNVLKKEFDMYLDIHTASWFMLISANTAFGFSLDTLCFLLTSMVTFSFLFLEKNFSGSSVGLAISQTIYLAGMAQYGMRQVTEAANHLTSVERVLEYTQLESEQKLQDKRKTDNRKNNNNNEEPAEEALLNPTENWPSDGSIEFRNVYMRYFDDGPYVLQGLTMAIQSGEKIGIVGRTGAGKSSLLSALFRLAEVEGVIEIDGVDTGKVSLENLRSHISIIPQDPVLFAGTLRRNLDPFQEYPDSLLWSVLEKVELKEAVRATENGLDHRVLDKGSNFSVGQRQLICLARAILRNNRILVLDEATANVDPQTDCLIQSTIRTQFSDCTVLTVAHRLNTIMDSDKILVMNEGRIEEFEHPHILLGNQNGNFTSLVKKTGNAIYQQLCEIAEKSYRVKFNGV